MSGRTFTLCVALCLLALHAGADCPNKFVDCEHLSDATQATATYFTQAIETSKCFIIPANSNRMVYDMGFAGDNKQFSVHFRVSDNDGTVWQRNDECNITSPRYVLDAITVPPAHVLAFGLTVPKSETPRHVTVHVSTCSRRLAGSTCTTAEGSVGVCNNRDQCESCSDFADGTLCFMPSTPDTSGVCIGGACTAKRIDTVTQCDANHVGYPCKHIGLVGYCDNNNYCSTCSEGNLGESCALPDGSGVCTRTSREVKCIRTCPEGASCTHHSGNFGTCSSGTCTICGDGNVEGGEQCEGTAATLCEDIDGRFASGIATCEKCRYNTAACKHFMHKQAVVGSKSFSHASFSGASKSWSGSSTGGDIIVTANFPLNCAVGTSTCSIFFSLPSKATQTITIVVAAVYPTGQPTPFSPSSLTFTIAAGSTTSNTQAFSVANAIGVGITTTFKVTYTPNTYANTSPLKNKFQIVALPGAASASTVLAPVQSIGSNGNVGGITINSPVPSTIVIPVQLAAPQGKAVQVTLTLPLGPGVSCTPPSSLSATIPVDPWDTILYFIFTSCTAVANKLSVQAAGANQIVFQLNCQCSLNNQLFTVTLNNPAAVPPAAPAIPAVPNIPSNANPGTSNPTAGLVASGPPNGSSHKGSKKDNIGIGVGVGVGVPVLLIIIGVLIFLLCRNRQPRAPMNPYYVKYDTAPVGYGPPPPPPPPPMGYYEGPPPSPYIPYP